MFDTPGWSRWMFLVFLAAAALAAGCGSPPPADAGTEAGATTAGDGQGTIVIPAPPQHAGTGDQALSWSAPASWIAEPPSSAMRKAQYRIGGPDGEAQMVVYYFGPGQGGDPMSNAQRWAHQFTGPDGQPALEAMTITDLEGAAIPIKIVEVTGTYSGGMGSGPGSSLDDAMLLGAIAIGPDAPWFFKMTGPESTVRAEKASFLEMLRGIRPGS